MYDGSEFRHEGWFLVPIFCLTKSTAKYCYSAFSPDKRWNIPLVKGPVRFDYQLVETEPWKDLSDYPESFAVVEVGSSNIFYRCNKYII